MSLLIGDDYPEAVEPYDRENPVPAEGLRGRPAPGGKRRDWSRWRGHRSRSMLIQDAPDPAEDGGEDEYGPGVAEGGPPYPGNGFFLDPGPDADGYPPDYYPEDRYPQDPYPDDLITEVHYPGDRMTGDRYPRSGYADSRDNWAGAPGPGPPGYPEPGHDSPAYSGADDPEPRDPGSGYPGSRYPGSGQRHSGHPGSGRPDPGYADPRRPGRGDPESGYGGWRDEETWSRAEGDGFRLPPAPEDDPWDAGDEYESALEEHPAGRRLPLLGVLWLRRESRDPGTGGSRKFVGSAQRLGGLLLAGASVVGVALYVPSILAADSRSFTGVVSSSGIASLNFAASGRVGSVRVRLGQAVRKGELLATETGAAGTAAVRADRAAITADKANLAALQADGSAAASITAAQAQLARDRARRAAGHMKLVATQIVAPRSGTVVAIFGQPGETVSPAGLRSSAVHGQAAPGQQPRFSLLPSGPTASLRAAGMAPPVIALRTGGGWQVRLLIPQADTSAVKVGGSVTISVPAAQLTGIKATITELSPTPVGSSGTAAYEAVAQVLGRTRITPLSGMTADVQLGSLRLRRQAAPASAPRAAAHPPGPHPSPAHGAGARPSG